MRKRGGVMEGGKGGREGNAIPFTDPQTREGIFSDIRPKLFCHQRYCVRFNSCNFA